MKFTATLISLALATFAAAQNPTLPDCAQQCANPYLTNGVGTCGTDPKCICANSEFISGISCCLADKCPVDQQSAAVNFASQFCAGAGVTGLPTTVSCATTAPGTAATNSASTTTSAAGTAATVSSSKSGNYGPRQTAAAGLGAIGGLVAAVAML